MFGGVWAVVVTMGLLSMDLAPTDLVFEVTNPQALGGHRLFHVEDFVGPNRRATALLGREIKAVGMISVRPEDCSQPASGWCGRLAPLAKSLRDQGVLVVALVSVSRKRVTSVQTELSLAKWPFVVALDPFAWSRTVLGWTKPGAFIVFDRDGVNTRSSPSSDSFDARAPERRLDGFRRAIAQALSP